jgi:hypothetical protein
MRWWAEAQRAGVIVALATLAACTAQHGFTSSRARQAGMPCSEAARVARGALVRLGYAAELVEAPKPGAPGKVVGHKNSGWSTALPEPGTEYTATVTITCSNQGAEFEALADEPIPAALTFKTDFAAAIQQVAERRIARPRLAERPEAGLVISVEPLRGSDASAEFGADLTASGITPVRLRIDNRSDRAYGFAGERVQLVTQEGERTEPLPDERVAALTGSLQSTVRKKRIADGEIAPQAVVSGFLYFPVSAYSRATLVLIDQQTDEEEGFSVEF